jgi:hypothetical protein
VVLILQRRRVPPQFVRVLWLLCIERGIVKCLQKSEANEELEIIGELTIQSDCSSVVIGPRGSRELVDCVIRRVQARGRKYYGSELLWSRRTDAEVGCVLCRQENRRSEVYIRCASKVNSVDELILRKRFSCGVETDGFRDDPSSNTVRPPRDGEIVRSCSIAALKSASGSRSTSTLWVKRSKRRKSGLPVVQDDLLGNGGPKLCHPIGQPRRHTSAVEWKIGCAGAFH